MQGDATAKADLDAAKAMVRGIEGKGQESTLETPARHGRRGTKILFRLSATFTTIAFDDSSSWGLEINT
jgi:hypothetical protein